MHIRRWAVLTALSMTACASRGLVSGDSQTLTAAQYTAAAKGARDFALELAHGVTSEGPSAWRGYFEDNRAFFMADEGRLVFPDSASANVAIEGLIQTTAHIDLKWGDDLRVDPLTPDLAMIAASYHEIRTNKSGDRVDERGFFTGLAEQQGGRWRLRNAHWSVIPPAK